MVLGQPHRWEDNQAQGFTQLTPWCRKARGNLPVSSSCKLVICPSSVAKLVQGVTYRRFLLNHSMSIFVRAKWSKQATATTFTKMIFTKYSWKHTHFILFNTRTFALTITAKRCSSKTADRASLKIAETFQWKNSNKICLSHSILPFPFWTFDLSGKRFLWQKHW